MAMKVPSDSKKIEDVEFETADGGMSADESLSILSTTLSGISSVATSVFMMKAFTGGGANMAAPAGEKATTSVEMSTIKDALPENSSLL